MQTLIEKEEDVEEQIINIILAFMTSAQDVNDRRGTPQSIKGFDKKKWVLQKISETLGADTFNRYGPFISLTIDFIKEVARNKAVLSGLIKKSKCSACF